MTQPVRPAAFAGGPLTGIRVLDLSTMLAGPYGATLLGDLGADVVKVESHYGDESRHLGTEKRGERSPFLALNRNKRAIVLDLAKPEAQQVFARLAKTSDALVTNVREPALSRLGVDYDSVRRHRADVVWVGVTAFGPDGPYAGRPGIDFLAQGYAGLIAGNGDPGAPAVRVTAPLVDVMTSMCVATGVLAALRVRDATGQGQRIDVSLLDVLTHAQASVLQSWLLAGEVVPRTGNRSHFFAPSGVYECGDGQSLCLTCPSEKFFRNLCRALGVAWADDARFARIDDRLANQDALDALIAARCRDFSRDALIEKLIAADVLAAPVNEIPDAVRDPQIRHNDMIVTTDHATLGSLEVTGVPIKLRGTPGSVRRAPPVKGQHTRELLVELGYAKNEIARLLDARIVAEPDASDARDGGPEGAADMQTKTNLKIVDARREHAPFIAWVILTAFRSHLEKGFWDFVRPGTDAEILRYLEALTTSKAPHWAHLSLFIVAEVDGEPAAALSGYFAEEHGGARLGEGIAEADAATGQSPDAASIGRALTILNVAPEHVPGAWIIEDVATRPEFRRRGLVDALMQEIMERGRKRGATVSDIGVFIGNDSAQKAYEKAGYVVVGEKTHPEFEAVYGTPGVRALRRSL